MWVTKQLTSKKSNPTRFWTTWGWLNDDILGELPFNKDNRLSKNKMNMYYSAYIWHNAD